MSLNQGDAVDLEQKGNFIRIFLIRVHLVAVLLALLTHLISFLVNELSLNHGISFNTQTTNAVHVVQFFLPLPFSLSFSTQYVYAWPMSW